MNKKIIQKSGPKTTIFTIDDTGLIVKIKSGLNEKDIHYPFEQIKTSRAILLDHNKGLLTVAFVFAGITAFVFISSFINVSVEKFAIPLWGSITMVLFGIYFKTRKRKQYLQTTENRSIEFVANPKNLDEITNFIEQLLTERNIYLVSKYGTLNRNIEFGPQLDNLNWLLNAKAISKAIYDEKILELNSLFNSHLHNKPIGFSARN